MGLLNQTFPTPGFTPSEDALREGELPRILVFACRWCGFIGADQAGRNRLPLPAGFRLIALECAARLDPEMVLRALADGVDGVAVLGCHLGGCRFHEANHVAAKRLQVLKDLLDRVGVGSHRLLLSWGTAHTSWQFQETIIRFSSILDEKSPCRPEIPPGRTRI